MVAALQNFGLLPRASWLRGLAKATALPAVVAGLATGCGVVTGAGVSPPAAEPLHARMSARDLALADAAVQRSLETQQSGVATSWRNERSGSAGTVTPVRTWKTRAGRYCRAYEERMSMDGERATYTGTACRTADGVWLPVDAS